MKIIQTTKFIMYLLCKLHNYPTIINLNLEQFAFCIACLTAVITKYNIF